MENLEFESPSPKRQRTGSPQVDKMPAQSQPNLPPQSILPQPHTQVSETNSLGQKSRTGEVETEDMLDVLMQHVEAESQPVLNVPLDKSTTAHLSTNDPAHDLISQASSVHTEQPTQDQHLPETQLSAATLNQHQHAMDEPLAASTSLKTEANTQDAVKESEQRLPDPDTAMAEAATEAIEMQATDNVEGAEWEVDSSPYESSSDSSDDTSSDSSDEDDADGDYALLDPEEQARILMHGEGGSDDEGDKSASRGAGPGLKTANEQTEDVPAIPEVTVTNDMAIDELGKIEAIVENNVLIMAKTSGEYRVLESGSLLCLEDRKVAGVVAETLGRVEQPLYTMKFASEANIIERNLEKGVTIFYVVSQSSFVFTQPLKAVKGSDASNIHDEEVAADDMEFSDDEAEAEYKRQLKLKKQGRLGVDSRGRGSGRGRGARGGKTSHNAAHEAGGAAYGNGSLEMNYDDVEDGEAGYTPLARPASLSQPAATSPASSTNISHMPPPPFSDRGRGRGQGRGARDRGRGGRGGSFRGRGGANNYQQQYQQSSPQQNHFQNPLQNAGFQLPFPPPPPPMLTPHNPSYPHPFIASPISPLPQQQFNFNAAFQAPQGYSNHYQPVQPPPPPPQQQQQQYTQPSGYYGASGMQQYGQQQQQHHHHQQPGTYGGQWQSNQAAVAEVQRQLEEMRQAAAKSGH